MFTRRMTVIVGRFGCGKTEIAVNGALLLARRGERVTLVDLDVVKPYFQCRSLRSEMADRGVRILAPDGETGLPDRPVMPAVPPEVRGLLAGGQKTIVDVGGDPVGTLAFGAVSDAGPRGEIDLLAVLNFARPQTETVEQAVAMVRAIQAAARLPVTGLVANTHLLGDTTLEIVRDGLDLAERTAAILGVPVAFAAVEERLAAAFPAGWASCPVLSLRRLVFPPCEAPLRREAVWPALAAPRRASPPRPAPGPRRPSASRPQVSHGA